MWSAKNEDCILATNMVPCNISRRRWALQLIYNCTYLYCGASQKPKILDFSGLVQGYEAQECIFGNAAFVTAIQTEPEILMMDEAMKMTVFEVFHPFFIFIS
ncbi:MAG TPA: hypothetical protein VER35_01525 [Candidatus Limnocylindrales bacterium]|nr:hypothetical protein [Candidatus Limnocylindrales bacterium]